MQVHNSQATNGGGVGLTPLTQRPQSERQTGRLQKENASLQEKMPGNGASSLEKSSGLNQEGAKVIIGPGGDYAVISRGSLPAATASESAATTTTSQANMNQKALIDSINLPHISEETKSITAELEAGAATLRNREAALDAEFTQSISNLAQTLREANSSRSADRVEKSTDDPDDDSETLMERMLSMDEEAISPEEQLRQSQMEQPAGKATQDAAPDSKGGTSTKGLES